MLCHLFCRIPCTRYEDEEWLENVVRRSPSLVILPRMPLEAEEIIRDHNDETLGIFRTYVCTYVEQHLDHTPDNDLPFSKTKIGPESLEDADLQPGIIPALPATILRSPFSALSGLTDDFSTICELCNTVRSGVFLEEQAIPFIRIYPHETKVPFNAYILDFFEHGDLKALVRDNGIKAGDVWFRLKDFSLILATIVSSLANFLDPKSGAMDDMVMIGVQDAGDVLGEENDAEGDEEEEHNAMGNLGAQQAPAHEAKKSKLAVKKGKVLDSWEDEDGTEDDGEAESSGDWHSEHGIDNGGGNDDGKDLVEVYQAFKILQDEFETKFRKVWA